jgi:uncharacterized membrane protein
LASEGRRVQRANARSAARHTTGSLEAVAPTETIQAPTTPVAGHALARQRLQIMPRRRRHAARWPATLALLALGAIYLVVAQRYRVGPPWLLLALVVLDVGSAEAARQRGAHDTARWLAIGLLVAATAQLVASAVYLVLDLGRGATQPLVLLGDAALMWAANVLTFALWYWEVDGGGPRARVKRAAAGAGSAAEPAPAHSNPQLGEATSPDTTPADTVAAPDGGGDLDPAGEPELLFPQLAAPHGAGWMPHFVDYLYFAFNTSTAFSPTDTAVLSTRTKLLTMAQSLISLVVTAVLLARAINTL